LYIDAAVDFISCVKESSFPLEQPNSQLNANLLGKLLGQEFWLSHVINLFFFFYQPSVQALEHFFHCNFKNKIFAFTHSNQSSPLIVVFNFFMKQALI